MGELASRIASAVIRRRNEFMESDWDREGQPTGPTLVESSLETIIGQEVGYRFSEPGPRAITTVSMNLLASLLSLPEGHRIVGILAAYAGTDEPFFEIVIQGPDCPKPETLGETPRVRLTYQIEMGEPKPSDIITCKIERA